MNGILTSDGMRLGAPMSNLKAFLYAMYKGPEERGQC